MPSQTMTGAAMPARWLSTVQAARELGITTRTLYRLIDKGKLIAYRHGRVIRIKATDLAAYLDSTRIQPGSLGHLHQATTDEDRPAGEDPAGRHP